MSGDEVDRTTFQAADPQLLSFILEESDKRVAAQVQLMIAADQRANGIVAACVSLSAAALGFAVSQFSGHADSQVFAAAIAFGAVEALAALFAMAALWPEPVNPPGWAPATFTTDLAKTPHAVKAEVAYFIQRRIEQNRAAAAKLSRRVKWALLLAVEGPLVGLCVAMIGTPLQWLAYLAGALAAAALVALGVPMLPGSFSRRRGA